MATPKQSPIPSEKIAQFEKLVATLPDVERKGAANPYTSVNGNMFSILHAPEGRCALRLPDEARQKFIEKFGTNLFEAYGVVMKEYVAVPDKTARRFTYDARLLRDQLRVCEDVEGETDDQETTRCQGRVETWLIPCIHKIPEILFLKPWTSTRFSDLHHQSR